MAIFGGLLYVFILGLAVFLFVGLIVISYKDYKEEKEWREICHEMDRLIGRASSDEEIERLRELMGEMDKLKEKF